MELSEEQIKVLMWSFVADNYDEINKWCKRAAHGDAAYADELFSDEVLRMMPALIGRWDQVRPFFIYARSYYRMHLSKKSRQRTKKRQRTQSYSSLENFNVPDKHHVNDPDDAEYVQSLLARLSEVDRTIVYRSVVLGHTTREIADDLPYSYTSIAGRLNRALEELRTYGRS